MFKALLSEDLTDIGIIFVKEIHTDDIITIDSTIYVTLLTLINVSCITEILLPRGEHHLLYPLCSF